MTKVVKEKTAQKKDKNIEQDKVKEKAKNKNKNKNEESGLYTAEIRLGDIEGTLRYAVSPTLGSPVPGLSSPYTEKFAPADGYSGVSLIRIQSQEGRRYKSKGTRHRGRGL